MRFVEVLLALADLLAFVALAVPLPRAVRWVRYAAPASLLIAAAQVLFEGGRWQMVPAYVLSALFCLIWLQGIFTPRSPSAEPRRLRRAGLGPTRALGVLGLALSIALPMLFPVFRLPQPKGPYGIGTATYHWVDKSRPEVFTADPNDRRELMVQIWYPAKADPSAPRAAYMKDPSTLAPLARLLGLPGFIFGHLKYVATNAVEFAPVADDEPGYPVLICSHGRGGYRQENTWLIEELVSHGYIVAAIDHPYAASGVIFPDGRRATFDPRMLDRTFVDGKIPYLAQDAIFTLSRLGMLNRFDPKGILTGRVDVRRVGIFGLSLGGEVSAEACRSDPRFRACLVMDVWMPADVLRSGLEQPTMFLTRDAKTMRLEGWKRADIDETLTTMKAVYEKLPGDGYFVQVPGMFHQDFADAPLLSPLTSVLGITGPIDGRRAHDITSAYALAFFDRELKGRSEALLEAPSKPYPEVLFEERRDQAPSDSVRQRGARQVTRRFAPARYRQWVGRQEDRRLGPAGERTLCAFKRREGDCA